MSGAAIPWAWRPRVERVRAALASGVHARTVRAWIGFVYFIAFTSFGTQAAGLIGSHGILPLDLFLAAARESYDAAAWWQFPTVLWLAHSDAAIAAVWVAGAGVSLAAMFASGWVQRAALAISTALWLSVCVAGQDFLSFQWDVLLLEAGFLAIFLVETRARILLFRWLIFRLTFLSGCVKLLSGDPAWRSLTAMRYHYETQPLPTPLAWYMQQLPAAMQRLSTAVVLVTEIAVPFLFFAPRRIRHGAAWATIALQLLIAFTGNYTFFNVLTIILALGLFLEPERGVRANRAVTAAVAAFVVMVSLLQMLEVFTLPVPAPGRAVLNLAAPFRLVNSYGLFAVMTTTRNEIVVEGSRDGVSWQAYEFPAKPGDVRRMPPWVAPDQPRLDWQMWFAALGTRGQNPWFTNFLVRLLQGEPAVLGLLSYNPFPGAPPKYVRAHMYEYHFTRFGEAGWWRREWRGVYCPAVSLR